MHHCNFLWHWYCQVIRHVFSISSYFTKIAQILASSAGHLKSAGGSHVARELNSTALELRHLMFSLVAIIIKIYYVSRLSYWCLLSSRNKIRIHVPIQFIYQRPNHNVYWSTLIWKLQSISTVLGQNGSGQNVTDKMVWIESWTNQAIQLPLTIWSVFINPACI